MNIVWLNKWALIKEKREEMERVCNHIRMIKSRKTVIVKAIKTFHILSSAYDIFSRKREAVHLFQRMNLAVIRFGLKFTRYLRKYAKTREQRNIRTIQK